MHKPYDIVLMGATSFVGQITARRFVDYVHETDAPPKVVLAGRSEKKLKQLLAKLAKYNPAVSFDYLVADSMQEKDMENLAAQARVVVSTVGPYELFGEALVKACCQAGTHYCDLTGEPLFIHNMLQRYQKAAQKSGACIMHCAGFDSLPSDIGTYFLQTQAIASTGQPCQSVDMRVKAMRGGLSGGTFASMKTIVEMARSKPEVRTILMDPYALCDQPGKERQTFVGRAQKDWASPYWMAPFLMASINSKIVLRSAQQLPVMYPASFRYNEAMLTGKGVRGWLKALGISLGMGLLVAGMAFSTTRKLLDKRLPQPGEGPSPKEQEEGFFAIQFYGKTESGERVSVKVTGDQDPGYGSTSKMLLQAALALLEDVPDNQRGGFYTPAALIGDALLNRLPSAGVTFKRES